jgi:hypothetical protein
MITAEATPMADIKKTFHNLRESQQWLNSFNSQAEQPTITLTISEEPEIDEYHASLPPEEQAKIEAGIERGFADVKAGRVMTIDQVIEKLHREFDQRQSKQPQKKRLKFSETPLCGMWADRDDIPDPSAYVRELRKPRYKNAY